MRQITLILVVAMALFSCQKAQENQVDPTSPPEDNSHESENWQILFSGENLDNFIQLGRSNWNLVNDFVESVDAKGSFLLTRESYGDFQMRLDFWPSPDANSGVFIRCQDLSVIANETCYELNIYDQHSNPDNATGSIINLAAPLVRIKAGNQWNTYDITARGDHIQVYLNDTLVVDFKNSSFKQGPIGLQSNGGLIRFRNVKVRSL